MAALAFLAVAAAVVSWDAQYVMVHQVKHAPAVAALEAGIPDAGALIFAALGIALALPGRRALRPRALNVACVIAGVGPGSSRADYEAVGVPFEQRWRRFDEGVRLLKPLLQPGAAADSGTYYATLVAGLSPSPRQCRGIPMWIGSWGSQAGLRRVACLGDGWLASAYNTTPETFAAAMTLLGRELERQAKPTGDFPNALVTMWVWITDKRSDAERVLSEVVGPLVKKDPAELRGRICVGSAHECAELLSRYARAGCQRVHFWPVGDERRQVELIAAEVMPRVCG